MSAIVLTGVSRGLGAELFTALHGRGDRVLAIGRRFTEAQKALAAADPDRVTLREADLGDLATLPDSAELADALGGEAHAVLVHNAAAIEPIGAVGSLPADGLASLMTVNLTAPMVLTNAFLAAAPAGAKVLFISSGAACSPMRGWSAYCASKAGGEMFFATLARERPDLAVHSVSPGVMDTGMQEAVRAADFPDRRRFETLRERDELADPAAVARKIINDYLTRE